MWGSNAKLTQIRQGLQGTEIASDDKPKNYTVNAGTIEKTSDESLSLKATATVTSSRDGSSIVTLADAKGKLLKVVLDSGAFITGTKIDNLGSEVEYYTIDEVVAELKDENARIRFQTFPFPIHVVPVTHESLQFVSDFAKQTGDYYALSTTDLKILALTYMLEVQTHGDAHIRKHPGEIAIPNEPIQSDIVEEEFFNNCSFAEEATINPFDLETFLGGTSSDFWALVGIEVDENGDPILRAEDMASDEPENSSSSASEMHNVDIFALPGFDDGQWITPDNYQAINSQVTNPTTKKSNVTPLSEPIAAAASEANPLGTSSSAVGCITTDYGMQNVLLQSGLRILAADSGLAITSLRQWMNRCHTCYTLTRDMSREFCPSCGGHTMIRVAVFVDPRGKVHYRWSNKKIFNKRGTRYSIPKPKGGKKNTDLRLREDAMPGGIDKLNHTSRQKKAERSAFETAAEFAWQKSKSYDPNAVFGYGNVNPNVVRRGKK